MLRLIVLRLIVLWSFFTCLTSAQVVPTTTGSSPQTSTQTSSSSTTSLAPSTFSLAFSSTSTPTSTSTSTTPTTTTPTTTVGQGPVDQPAPTTGTPGGPTPYTYTTIADGVTQVVTAVFTPTSPPTVLVTPSLTGTVLDFSSWLSQYGPTQTSSAGAGYPLSPIPFTLILIMLLSILGGGGLLYV